MKNEQTHPVALFFYEVLLGLYPEQYRKAYGEEMRLLFHDLYAEELEKHREISIFFWITLLWDVITTTVEQHKELLKRIGVLRYAQTIYNIRNYTIIGAICLVPVILIACIDTIAIVLTGNHKALAGFYTSPFWSFPVIFLVVVLLPFIALVVNLIGIIRLFNLQNHTVLSLAFLARQVVSIGIIILALGIFLLLLGHDFIPCLASQTVHAGLLHIFKIFQICRNA